MTTALCALTRANLVWMSGYRETTVHGVQNISNRQRLLRSVVVASAADEEEFTLVNLQGGKCL